MTAFVRRFDAIPPLETLLDIESINLIDIAPAPPTTGTTSGAILVVGEFEDGPFAAGGDSADYNPALRGVLEVFGTPDQIAKYGGFGYQYGDLLYRNPCARTHGGELWNGNGYLKMKFMVAQRFMIARVDSSLGSVAFSPLASVATASAGPWALSVGNQLTMTTATGGPASSTAIAAAPAQVTGVAGVYPTLFAGGEAISIAVDHAAAVTVTFTAGDQTLTDVINRINGVFGYALASNSGGQLRLTGQIQGTFGQIVTANVSGTPLATLGMGTGATTNGTGNVANLAAVTATEIAAIVNGTAGLTAINVSARVASDGTLRLRHATWINVSVTTMATTIGLTPTATQVNAGVHAAGRIPAGTRVRTAGGAEWVTMQTLTLAEGTTAIPNAGPHTVKVRAALDNGSSTQANAATIVNIETLDMPTFSEFSVNNPAIVTAALTEPQLDARYDLAWDATKDPNGSKNAAIQANISVCARRSVATVTKGRQNAIDASSSGLYGRKFVTRAPLSTTDPSVAVADVALYRSDRLIYTWPGWQVIIPEIATVGAAAGGIGFNDTGLLTVGADAPLATCMAILPPEENPAQATGRIEQFFALQDIGRSLTIDDYKALKRGGICAPNRDPDEGSAYQSGITSSLTAGRTNIRRRSMADFIQDSLAIIAKPYSKKLQTSARKDGLLSAYDSFLSGLLSRNAPEAARIGDYAVDGVTPNTPQRQALGLFWTDVQVRTIPDFASIVIQTEVGDNTVIVREL